MSAAADNALAWALSRTHGERIDWPECAEQAQVGESEGGPIYACVRYNIGPPDGYDGGEAANPYRIIQVPTPLDVTIYGGFNGGGGVISKEKILGYLRDIGTRAGMSPDFDWTPYLALAAKKHWDQYGTLFQSYESYYGFPIHVALAEAARDFPANELLPAAVQNSAMETDFGNAMETWRAKAYAAHNKEVFMSYVMVAAIIAAPLAMIFSGAGAAAGAGTVSAGAGSGAEIGAILASEDIAMGAALASDAFTAGALATELAGVESLATATPAQTSLLTQAADFMGLDSLQGALINMGKSALAAEVKKAIVGAPPKPAIRAPSYLQPPQGARLQPAKTSGILGADAKPAAWGAALALISLLFMG